MQLRLIFAILILYLFCCACLRAQSDTMYIMKSGDVVGKYHVIKQMDSLLFHKPKLPNTNTYIARLLVKGGTFTMGSPMSELNRDMSEVQHQVIVSDFLMSKYEITNAQFATFLNENKIGSDGLYASGSYPTQPLIYPNITMGLVYSSKLWLPVAGYENHPVVNVTWYGASEFAIYAKGSLPTEAQWEYACRANTASAFNTGNCIGDGDAYYNWLYPYGTCTNTVATFPLHTQTVGLIHPNAFGLYDMHGNVLEWCADWYGDYPVDAQQNPTGPLTGTKRIYRGGAWTSPAKYCRSAWRSSQLPSFYNQSVGFRLVFPYVPDPAMNDTLYVMKGELPVAKYNIKNQVDSVIFYRSNQESTSRLPGFLTLNPNLSIFVEALYLTHLSDSIRQVMDVNYHPTKVFMDEYNFYQIINPPERRYAYTVFVEDNQVLSENGIHTIDDLISKANELYPGGANYAFTDGRNSLNKYIAYHLVNKAIQKDKFFYSRNAIPGYTPDEFIETMYTNRLIKASKIANRITLNPNCRDSVHVMEVGSQSCVNGVFHLLDHLLVYSDSVERMMQNTRIRFDVASLFPEMTNNNIRASEGVMKVNNSNGDKYGFESGYLKNMQANDYSRIIYLSGKDKQYSDYQADEFLIFGNADFTVRLLPVPPGIYELRYSITPYPGRTIAQIAVDDIPLDYPIDYRIPATSLGWKLDSSTPDNGLSSDSTLRENGYMKAPNTCLYYGSVVARDNNLAVRNIIGTYTFTDYRSHTIRFQTLLNSQTQQSYLDYFEFVPVSVFKPANGKPESRE